jgi:MtN3 and saliva related transmembrane protein
MHWPLIGVAAAILTMFSFVPQIIKVLRTRSVKDVSIITVFQLSCGSSLWIAYGVHLKDSIIIAANVITLVTLMVVVYLYFNFGKVRE